MEICAIIENNPFFANSASANRWKTLIEGLLNQLDISFHIIITKGYNSFDECKQMGIKGAKSGYSYQYICPLLNSNLWLRRINKYLLVPIFRPWIRFKTIRLIKSKSPDIIWTSSDNDSFRVAVSLKKQNIKSKLLLELSEFLDIHLNDQGHALIKKHGDARKSYFEKKAFYAYDFLILMTKTLHHILILSLIRDRRCCTFP
jgi:hypothetical protein